MTRHLFLFSLDPDAEAVVIFDIGEAIFFDAEVGYDIRFTRSRRIKILDQSGVDFAEVAIPIYVAGAGKTEVVKSVIAYSYNNENTKLLQEDESHSNKARFG